MGEVFLGALAEVLVVFNRGGGNSDYRVHGLKPSSMRDYAILLLLSCSCVLSLNAGFRPRRPMLVSYVAELFPRACTLFL